MSVWKRKAIECLPELQNDFQNPTTSIYSIFSGMIPALVEAHKVNNVKRIKKIYDFAKWCSTQKEKDLWNALGYHFMNIWVTIL